MNKENFPLLRNNPGLVYLDNSATTQKPEQVIKSMSDFYENFNANVHRGIHKLSMQATLAYQQARQTVAGFIGAAPEEIIFTKGTTEALNFLAQVLSLGLKPGDEIVLTEMEHHSNLLPWLVLARQKNLQLKFIQVTDDFRLDLTAARKMITSKTKIVSMVQMSNVLGTINPIQELAHLAQAVGSVLIVDAAQSIAHLPINVKELNCDFLVFSGHKIGGPTGIGVLYGKKERLETLEPYQYGGGMVKEVLITNSSISSSWANLPQKFEAGTPPIAEAVGLAAAVNYLQSLGLARIWQHSAELTKLVLDKLLRIPRLKLLGPAEAEQRGPIFSFIIEGIHSHDLGEALDNKGIAVRAGHHCAKPLLDKFNVNDAIRASFYIYNDSADVDKLLEALSSFVAIDRQQVASSEFSVLTVEQEISTENVLDHYNHPRYKGTLPLATLAGREANPLCGDMIELFMQVEHSTITAVKWEGQGCVISQASISLLSDKLIGLSIVEAKEIVEQEVLDLLGIPISYTRMNCALLSLKALHSLKELHPLKALQGALK